MMAHVLGRLRLPTRREILPQISGRMAKRMLPKHWRRLGRGCTRVPPARHSKVSINPQRACHTCRAGCISHLEPAESLLAGLPVLSAVGFLRSDTAVTSDAEAVPIALFASKLRATAACTRSNILASTESSSYTSTWETLITFQRKRLERRHMVIEDANAAG